MKSHLKSSLTYSSLHPGKWIDQLALKKRKIMFEIFAREFPIECINHILDIGVTADKEALSSNYFEAFFPYKHKITALSNQNASFLESCYPGLTFKLGDALNLAFPDKSMDVIFSSAVIEHVGSFESQKQMIAECTRVSQTGFFITTPNRWHPLEAHTFLPFIHWLPKRLHRKILTLLGMHFYADEKNLNLLDEKRLQQICYELNIQQFKIKKIRTFGMVSNLMLVVKH